MTRSIIFLLVILLVTCIMMAPLEGFKKSQPKTKHVASIMEQANIRKAENALKKDLRKANKMLLKKI